MHKTHHQVKVADQSGGLHFLLQLIGRDFSQISPPPIYLK